MRAPTTITKELSYVPERFRRCNCYLLDLGGQILLFDPSFGPDSFEDSIEVKAIYASHAHYDHIGGISSWKDQFPHIPFLMHPADEPMLEDPAVNASLFFGRPQVFSKPDQALSDGQLIQAGNAYTIEVINTPGHTMGSSCFLINRQEDSQPVPIALLTGDTLFDRSWGRTDFVTGDEDLMRGSLERLYQLLTALPLHLPVCPGHGSITNAQEAARFLASMGFSG
jgi:hydroxyacylglutathione hydrolase